MNHHDEYDDDNDDHDYDDDSNFMTAKIEAETVQLYSTVLHQGPIFRSV